jgi:hypothetical protein
MQPTTRIVRRARAAPNAHATIGRPCTERPITTRFTPPEAPALTPTGDTATSALPAAKPSLPRPGIATAASPISPAADLLAAELSTATASAPTAATNTSTKNTLANVALPRLRLMTRPTSRRLRRRARVPRAGSSGLPGQIPRLTFALQRRQCTRSGIAAPGASLRLDAQVISMQPCDCLGQG